jgi:hypothetical protein
MLSFYSASSSAVNSRRAMAECLEVALEPTGGTDCDVLVFHTTVGHQFADLLSEARKLAPSAVILGCTCHGVVGREGANESMRGLAIMAIRGPRHEWAVAAVDNIRGHNSLEQSKVLGQRLREQSPNIRMVCLLASGIDIAADRAIEGLEASLGSDVRIFGGTSSDNMRAIRTYQFFDDRILERGALALGLADPTLDIEMGVHHGSVPVGMPFTVTRAEANHVLELDGRPGWHVLMEQLGKPIDIHPGPVIPIAGMGVELEDSLKGENDNPHILRVIAKTEPDGSFYMPVDIAVGTKMWLMERDEKLIFEGLDRMLGRLKAKVQGRELVAVFHTDCAARGRALFSRILKDEIVSRMQQPLIGEREQPLPWLGMYGFGEFTQLGGRNFFHNYTSSIYCLLRRGDLGTAS